jgi:hypothetical protein
MSFGYILKRRGALKFKVFIAIITLVCCSFTCFGYAALTDDLEIRGSVTATAPIEALYIVSVTQKEASGGAVLVPTKSSSKETVRKAAVAEGNHKVDPDTVKSPPKKIISVVKRRVEDILSGS